MNCAKCVEYIDGGDVFYTSTNDRKYCTRCGDRIIIEGLKKSN